jgi:phosphatidylinositol alpha-mannosyltransferase
MKIAHVTPYDLSVRGGVNASVVELVRRQGAVGHEVDLIGGASADPADVPNWKRVRSMIISVPANGSVAALAIPTAAGPGSELERLAARGAYDVLVVHEPVLPLGLAMLDVSRSTNVGVVHAYSETLGTVTRLVTSFAPPGLVRRSAPWVRKLHHVIAVSSAAREFASSYLGGDYEVVPNGIEVRYLTGRAPDRATIFFLGRPEPRKGLDVLLHALPFVRRDVPTARLVVAGDGTPDQWARYRDLADALGIASAVSFVGRVSENEKAALFSRATVYASPATGGESQGIVLLEAMAQGVPVVASDIAGYRTVITNGSDGLLVRPSDPIALAQEVARVLGDPTLAGGLSASARAAVERTYDWRVVIPRHITAYRNANLAASAETAVA